jgi:Ner family transcriptional regulator
MDEIRQPKKTSRAKGVDWNKAYIVAALHAGGTSLRKLSVAKGYSENTLRSTLHRPWPKGEKIIAEAIGEKPHDVWPTRYDADGKPLSGFGQRKERGQGKHVKQNSNTLKLGRNAEIEGTV